MDSANEKYSKVQLTGLILGPLVFVVMLLLDPPEGMPLNAWKTASAALWIAIWWMTEAIPLSATSLLPLVLFPALELFSIRDTAIPYASPTIFLFLGAFIIARSMEVWGLHKRIALNIIQVIGTSPRSIIIGFMIATAFLSMWISNTATSLMILPIALSVMALAKQDTEGTSGKNFGIVLLLAIAYSCSLGGMASKIGTPTNLVLTGYFEQNFGLDIPFIKWFMVGLPITLVSMPIMYYVLTKWVFPIEVEVVPGGKELIRKELKQLGKISRPELGVTVVFVSVAFMWVFRPFLSEFIPGLSDTTVAVLGSLFLFVIPVNIKKGQFLLSWKQAEKLPWGILLLFGGGLSLAAAIADSGLAQWIGENMNGLSEYHPILIILVVVFIIVMLTELTSNVATAAAFLPMVVSLAQGIGIDPLVLAVPAVIAASCAFMLPVATPPNAVVYSSGALKISDMTRGGVALNFILMVIVTVMSYYLVPMVF